jgi:CHAT domain-containing protein
MIRRAAVALLLLAAAASHQREGQSAGPAVLYEQGRAAAARFDYRAAQRIAIDGERRFASQPPWRELFAVLEAEAIVKNDPRRALRILEETPKTGASHAAIRRLMVSAAAAPKAADANALYLKADALAAQFAPQLRPEIAARRLTVLLPLEKTQDIDLCVKQALDGANAFHQPWVRFLTYIQLGDAASKQTHWPEAIRRYDAALESARAARSKQLEYMALAKLGWCYDETSEFDAAIAAVKPALLAAQAQADDYWTFVTANRLANVYLRRLEYGTASSFAWTAFRAAQRSQVASALANSYHQLACLAIERGKYAEAKTWNEQALALRLAQHDRAGEMYQRSNQARILAGTGNPAEALNILRALLASKDLDDAMRWRAQGIMAGIYEQLGKLPEAEAMYEQTLKTGAAARAKVRGSDSALAFERNLFHFYDKYIGLLTEQGRNADALMIAERSRARSLRETLGDDTDKRFDPKTLAREKNATILAYWVGPQRSVLWTITPRGIDVDTTLPGDEQVDRLADAYRDELLRARHKLARTSPGAELYTTLVAPAHVPPGSRVIIRPDAHLTKLNFETLIVPEPKPHYWIEDATISDSPSLFMLAKTPRRQRVAAPRALLLGDVPAAGREYPQLQRAAEELDDVARHFPSRCVVLTKSAATPAAYLGAQPSQFQFIHFAAHATPSTRAALDSSVILARDAKYGVRLSADQIVKTPLTADLVTVSSCYSAGGRSYAGEGLVGLAWAFLGAGAHRVVAAQWEVNDFVAPQIMNAMYDGISAGLEPAEALRRAKLKLVRSDSVQSQPLYWGPFVLYGE